jgi:hypothetical protein
MFFGECLDQGVDPAFVETEYSGFVLRKICFDTKGFNIYLCDGESIKDWRLWSNNGIVVGNSLWFPVGRTQRLSFFARWMGLRADISCLDFYLFGSSILLFGSAVDKTLPCLRPAVSNRFFCSFGFCAMTCNWNSNMISYNVGQRLVEKEGIEMQRLLSCICFGFDGGRVGLVEGRNEIGTSRALQCITVDAALPERPNV